MGGNRVSIMDNHSISSTLILSPSLYLPYSVSPIMVKPTVLTKIVSFEPESNYIHIRSLFSGRLVSHPESAIQYHSRNWNRKDRS